MLVAPILFGISFCVMSLLILWFINKYIHFSPLYLFLACFIFISSGLLFILSVYSDPDCQDIKIVVAKV
jgi:hypothetical protein